MSKRKTKTAKTESDSAYFLKLVMYLVISSLWLRIQTANGGELPLPIGACLALVFAAHEHFKIDRKIEYAIVLVGMFVSFWLPIGIYLSL